MHSLPVRKAASNALDPKVAARELYEGMWQDDIALAIFYCSPFYDLEALGRELKALFGDTKLIGCTTAGEISTLGYLRGSLSGVSIASKGAISATVCLHDLHDFAFAQGEDAAKKVVSELSTRGKPPKGDNTFGFLMVDGLSMLEESVISALYRSVGDDIQLFGGSAGDETRFGKTHVYYDGSFHTDAAVFTLVQTDHPFVVFKTEHFVGTQDKLVVTEADPARRVVTEINGVPAGREYARIVGLEVDKLTPLIFATYPVVVRVGGQTFVRSIQKVNEDESLSFFCAIDEGIVLTVARGVDIVQNLKDAFQGVRDRIGEPELVLGCDCVLRHLELDQRGIKDDVARVFAENNVVGFATYGEQYNAMHVNQTFTGVAIGRRPESHAG